MRDIDTAVKDADALTKTINVEAKSAPEKLDSDLMKEMELIRGDANKQLNSARVDLNLQLNKFNSTLIDTSKQLTDQTGSISENTNRVLATLDHDTLPSINKLSASTNTVVSDPDIPKLVRDTRQTMAITGRTMSHVEATANVIAQQAPEVGKSVAGVSSDLKKIADDVAGPKPWWKKVLEILTDAGALKSLF